MSDLALDSVEGRLPPEWGIFPLSELATIESGGNAPQGEHFFNGGSYPFVRVQHFDGSSRYVQRWDLITEEAVNRYKLKTFPAESIVFPKSGASINLEKRAKLPRDSCVVSHLAVVRPLPARCDSDFLYFCLRTLAFARSSGGTTLPFLSLGDIARREVPVPPLSEQRAIAAVLSKIQAAVEVQEKTVATLKELKAATMAKLFREGLRSEPALHRQTRFGEVPEEWSTQPLSEHAYVQTGVAKGRKIESSSAIELPYLRVANVQDGYLDLSEIKTIRLRETERERYSLHPGDVLLTEGGDFDKLGRGYLWKGQIGDCVHQNHIFAVRTNRETLLPEFFVYLVQSPYGKAYFLTVAHKTTNLACINSHKLKAFPVLLPSLSEQHEIAEILEEIDQKTDQQANKLKSLKYLFSSMLHLLMTGQVRVTQKMIALQALEERKKRKKKYSGKLNEEKLKEIVRRLVEAVDPEKIILFGSAVRGEMGPDSDVDLLVIKSCTNKRRTWEIIEKKLGGIGVPKDIVVATPEDIEYCKDIPGYVIRYALREGKVVYPS